MTTQSDRELIAEARRKARRMESDNGKYSPSGHLISRLADTLSARLPCIVGSVEELDALPVGSVVRSAPGKSSSPWDGEFIEDPVIAERVEPGTYTTDPNWHFTGYEGPYSSSEIPLPAVVLWTPEDEGAK